METRSIAIGLVAIVAAFAAAFGVAKSGGSETATAGAGVQAETIKVASPAAVAGVEVGGTLPALKAERKAPAKKKKGSSGSDSSSTTPSATAEPSTPSTNDTTPPATNNTTPPANTTPQVSKPKPQAEEPASGGGEDG